MDFILSPSSIYMILSVHSQFTLVLIYPTSSESRATFNEIKLRMLKMELNEREKQNFVSLSHSAYDNRQ